MCTRGNTILAIVAPISAAAMLSRNDDSTKVTPSSANAPPMPPGSTRGSDSGAPLSSKCRASNANPVSSSPRLAITTHSWVRCAASPARPAPSRNGLASTL